MTITFSAIPDVPVQGVTPLQQQFMTAVKDNLEIALGLRGKETAPVVFRDTVTVSEVKDPNLTSISAAGVGFMISGAKVVSFDDYFKLLKDFSKLSTDVNILRQTVNLLIAQLKDR